MRGPVISLAYDPRMRTLLIIVMMALAPLRAWAGDAMAIGMAAAQVAVIAPATSEPALAAAATRGSGQVDTDFSVHADCVGHDAIEVAAVQDSDASQDHAVPSHCPTCSFCQVCSSPGIATTGSMTGTVRFVHKVPLSGGTHFTSAERAPGFKPPIS